MMSSLLFVTTPTRIVKVAGKLIRLGIQDLPIFYFMIYHVEY